MKKWFKHQWVLVLFWARKLENWAKRKGLVKPPKYDPKPYPRMELDEYADDQIKALIVAAKAYRKAKANPALFVEQYFGAKIAPRPSPDTWAYDLCRRERYKDNSPYSDEDGQVEFTWSGRD